MPAPLEYVPGTKYGRWTLLKEADDPRRDRYFICRCDCGLEKIVHGRNLRTGKTRSCGCLRNEVASKGNSRHRHSRNNQARTKTYNTWAGMMQRCRYPKHQRYDDYGGRGIEVCERWLDFTNFLADMGDRPAKMSIDRIDPDGDYEPSNCRWATAQQQQANKRKKDASG